MPIKFHFFFLFKQINIIFHLIRGLVGWSRVISGWFVLGVLGYSLVLDISDVSVAVGLVGNNLGAAIGEGDAVRSGGDFTIAALRMGVVVVRRSIVDFPGEAVRLCGLFKIISSN